MATAELDSAYRVLGSDGKPRPDFHWDDPNDTRDVVDVLREEGVRFDTNGAADPSQRITAAELDVLIAEPDDESLTEDETVATELVGREKWDWERYVSELNVPGDRVDTARALVELVSEAIAERQLPWKPVFRKGYVAFQRPGQYNTLVVDLYWRKAPRLAIKVPADPAELSLVSPYPDLEESWYADEREWGWTVNPLDDLPNVSAAVEIARRYHTDTGATPPAAANNASIRDQLVAGLTPDQIYAAAGEDRAAWLTAIEEEARLKGELDALDPTPENVAHLRDEGHLRWERISARVFGDARRIGDAQRLYDEARGEGAAKRSYTGRGRRFPDMND
jgi:hypothetical protein